MNKYNEAYLKIVDRLDGDWQSYGWRQMSNEAVDQDVANALSKLEDLVLVQELFSEMYRSYVINEANVPFTIGAQKLAVALKTVRDEILIHLDIKFEEEQ